MEWLQDVARRQLLFDFCIIAGQRVIVKVLGSCGSLNGSSLPMAVDLVLNHSSKAEPFV